jgi:aryl-alcohol dehydrogenase-like predicted oxidoreductase
MPLSLDRRPPEAQAMEVIQTFLDAGGDFIDTANVYCIDDSDIGHNERLIAKTLRELGKTKAMFVATKGGLRRPNGRWEVDGNPKFIRASCEQSLKDLGVDCIALYQLHAVDARVPFADTLGELQRLKDEGKIAHIGLSNISSEQLETALKHVAVVSVQNRCNALEKRDFRNGLVDLCARHNVAFIPHSPVGGYLSHVRIGAQPVLKKLTDQHGVSAYQIVLAWLLAKGGHVFPIPGASRPASIRDSMEALRLNLTDEDIRAIDQMADA